VHFGWKMLVMRVEIGPLVQVARAIMGFGIE
jgi:hypothetical protein